MEINSIEVKAVAQRIGKSKKESILVDGEVFIKSCNIGLWNYITVCEANHYTYPDCKLVGRRSFVERKHRDEFSASLSAKAATAESIAYSKESGRDSEVKYKVIKIERLYSV
ncbi:hypothetical protein KO527_05250 [Pseudoalteromonas sp. C2R02]|uniref:hypothetical protein n=1 Tax=Pseudoalteromonas sp. C2R02 TaxID=2841565 RepID=UPI001C081961|nr:hypothetical protein [Pseudoalteromonas sp. C2R02]MBU2968754.1 hypothetical protein [Pseudoalteromonas sp. C2R02]